MQARLSNVSSEISQRQETARFYHEIGDTVSRDKALEEVQDRYKEQSDLRKEIETVSNKKHKPNELTSAFLQSVMSNQMKKRLVDLTAPVEAEPTNVPKPTPMLTASSDDDDSSTPPAASLPPNTGPTPMTQSAVMDHLLEHFRDGVPCVVSCHRCQEHFGQYCSTKDCKGRMCVPCHQDVCSEPDDEPYLCHWCRQHESV